MMPANIDIRIDSITTRIMNPDIFFLTFLAFLLLRALLFSISSYWFFTLKHLIGVGNPFSLFLPKCIAGISFLLTTKYDVPLNTMCPGLLKLWSLAAMFTVSPYMSPLFIMTSPVWIPILIFSFLLFLNSFCSSIPHRIALVGLLNVSRKASPIFLMMLL